MSLFTEKVTYKGDYGIVIEDVERIDGVVKNDFTGEEYEVSAPSLMKTTVWSQDQVKKGDMVMTSSGEFDVDALRGCYTQMNHDCFEAEVVLKFVSFEGSGYIPEKSSNGGGYLHKWWKVLEVKSSNYIE